MSNPFRKYNQEITLVKPRSNNNIHYGVDLIHYWNTEEVKLVEYDPQTLSQCNDKAVFEDELVEMFKAERKLEGILKDE